MADFTWVTEANTYNFTLQTAVAVDQAAHARLDAIRQVPTPNAQGLVLTSGANGTYGFSAATATDTVAQSAAGAAGKLADDALTRANDAYARTVAKPYPWHQTLIWNAAASGTDKYPARDATTYGYARYIGPTDPTTLGRTLNTGDEWKPTT